MLIQSTMMPRSASGQGGTAITTMVRMHHSLWSLAFSSSAHGWTPSIGVCGSRDFVSRLSGTGVSKIAFLRHGKTAPAKDGMDFDRQLTDEGHNQAKESGSSFGERLKPFYKYVVVSPSPRTMETASLFLSASGVSDSSVGLKPVQGLYDGTIQPEGSKLFRKIGYAPLRDYVENHEEGDRTRARTVLGHYAETAVDSILGALESPATSSSGGRTLLVVGHAVYLPAAALGVATLSECDEESKDMILSTATGEAEGYVVDVEHGRVEYLSRTR